MLRVLCIWLYQAASNHIIIIHITNQINQQHWHGYIIIYNIHITKNRKSMELAIPPSHILRIHTHTHTYNKHTLNVSFLLLYVLERIRDTGCWFLLLLLWMVEWWWWWWCWQWQYDGDDDDDDEYTVVVVVVVDVAPLLKERKKIGIRRYLQWKKLV